MTHKQQRPDQPGTNIMLRPEDSPQWLTPLIGEIRSGEVDGTLRRKAGLSADSGPKKSRGAHAFRRPNHPHASR